MTTLLDELVTELKDQPLETLSAREEVTLLLERLVAKYGRDYVYQHVANPTAPAVSPGCFYGRVTESETVAIGHVAGIDITVEKPRAWEPSCIVGHVLHLKDPRLLDEIILQDDPSKDGSHYNQWGILPLAAEEQFLPETWVADQGLIKALANLQGAQDDGMSWGEAFDEFRMDLALLDEDGARAA